MQLVQFWYSGKLCKKLTAHYILLLLGYYYCIYKENSNFGVETENLTGQVFHISVNVLKCSDLTELYLLLHEQKTCLQESYTSASVNDACNPASLMKGIWKSKWTLWLLCALVELIVIRWLYRKYGNPCLVWKCWFCVMLLLNKPCK